MASCACCGTTIIFGKKVGTDRYCNDACTRGGPLYRIGRQLPENQVAATAQQLLNSPCPKCRSAGPVELHTAHTIWSAILVTSWNNTTEISCKTCGLKRQGLAFLQSAVLGWWGFPWGILGTPVTLLRNLVGMASGFSPRTPSRALQRHARAMLAVQAIQAERAAQADPDIEELMATFGAIRAER